MAQVRLRLAPALMLAVLVAGCSDDKPKDIASGLITMAAGGTLKTVSGITLEVPPGAVPRDVVITVSALAASQFSQQPTWGAAVQLEPNGLTLAAAAKLTLPLVKPATAENPPRHLEFMGNDSQNAYDNGLVESVAADGKSVVLSITHFSGAICAENCHAGTREFLTAAFAARGLSANQMLACIQKKFPKATLPTTCNWLGPIEVQTLLESFFDQLGGSYGPNVDVPPDVVAQLAAAAAAGRNVSLAFGAAAGARSGPSNLYQDIDHTTVVEMKDGKWQIRGALVTSSPKVLAALKGTNVAWWPLDDLNGFRKLPQGVAVEMQACGKPGCLGSDQPMTGPYPPLALRMNKIPWSAVRIYVERPGAIASCMASDAGAPSDGAPADAGPAKDAGPADGAVDAAVDAPIDAPVDVMPDSPPDVLVCPMPQNTVGFCAGENNCPAGGPACACNGSQFCCTPGYCYTRYIAGCSQETCPPGAGRNYTNYCTCPPNTKPMYDPCRGGFLLSCDPM